LWYFLSEPVEILERDFRVRRHADQNEVSAPLPRIPNPIACLSPNDMLIFQLTINHIGMALLKKIDNLYFYLRELYLPDLTH